jgi:hypothetical protein
MSMRAPPNPEVPDPGPSRRYLHLLQRKKYWQRRGQPVCERRVGLSVHHSAGLNAVTWTSPGSNSGAVGTAKCIMDCGKQ